jgi:DNA-directed RNA polymerase specialized sigma subunit
MQKRNIPTVHEFDEYPASISPQKKPRRKKTPKPKKEKQKTLRYADDPGQRLKRILQERFPEEKQSQWAERLGISEVHLSYATSSAANDICRHRSPAAHSAISAKFLRSIAKN